jgi:hypothetical protein
MCSARIFRQDQYRGSFSDPHFQGAMGIAQDKAKLGWLMTSFLLLMVFHQYSLVFWRYF